MDDEVASLRKARNDLEYKLDAALENRTARIQEDEMRARQARDEQDIGNPGGRGGSDGTRSPSSESRSTSRRGATAIST